VKKETAVWIKADEGTWTENKPRITTGLESGADCIVVNAEDMQKVRTLGNVRIAAPDIDADIILVGKGGEGDGTKTLPVDLEHSGDISKAKRLAGDGKTIAGYVIIKNKKYEEFALEQKSCDYLIVIGTDWKVIPLRT
jgi:3-dehydroquinate synthase II